MPKADDPELQTFGLAGFRAAVKVQGNFDGYLLSLDVPAEFAPRIAEVTYQGHYAGYDENGDGRGTDWHGFTKNRVPTAVIGRADSAVSPVEWDTSLLPAQGGMQVRALIRFKGVPNLVYETAPTGGLSRPAIRPKVILIPGTEQSVPFWSRVNRLKTCQFVLDADPAAVEKAALHIAVWDGGVEKLKEPVTLNGHALDVVGKGKHDVIYKQVPIDPSWLKRGKNTLAVVSDTEHHGVEVLYPGPALAVRLRE